MTCSGCGSSTATGLRAGFYKNEKGEREYFEVCNACGGIGNAYVADVFWDGSPEHGLADDPKTGQPRVFGSKSEKARYLKENFLEEAGDKIHGAPPSILREQGRREDPKASALAALKQVREMGFDQRRRALNKILVEARKREEHR
jgi:hypothetical protein